MTTQTTMTPTGLAFDAIDRQAHAMRRETVGQLNCGLVELIQHSVDGVVSVCAAVRQGLQRNRDELFFESQQ